MKIEEQRQGSVILLKPQGPLIGADAEQLQERLAKAMEESSGRVALNVSTMAFADSRGLEVLVDTAEKMIERGKTLSLIQANAILQEILELTELTPLFKFCDKADAAVESLQ